jgi:hypothetical protein
MDQGYLRRRSSDSQINRLSEFHFLRPGGGGRQIQPDVQGIYPFTAFQISGYGKRAASLPKADILGNLEMAVPPDSPKGLGGESRLGEDLFLGEKFESEKPELKLSFQLDGPEDVQKAIKVKQDREILDEICRYALPFYLNRFETEVDPDSEGIEFTCGKSYLGFSTAMNPGESERG